MSGLGIVLEESDSPSLLRTGFMDADKTVEAETLLPPLLHEQDSPDKSLPLLGLVGTSASIPPSLASPADSGIQPIRSVEFDVHHDLQSMVVPTGFSSETSEIEFDSKLLSFPSIEPPTPSLTTFLTILVTLSGQGPQAAASLTPSPLSRLKSFKKGIRKLSLSRMGSSISLAAPSLSPDLSTQTNRPNISPLQLECHNDASYLSSCNESSPLSSLGALVFCRASCSSPSSPSKQGDYGECSHQHTSSALPFVSSAGQIPLPKVRERIHSQLWNGNGAVLPLPIITLSDNLPSSTENLSGVDQSFFGTVCRSPLSANTTNADTNTSEIGNTLSKFNTPEDLIDYLLYLTDHKRSVEGAFTVAEDRLLNSGWCSRHDIENLNLQRDVSLSQIDTKLLQIEEKLNSEFQISMLNNINGYTSAKDDGRRKPGVREPLSPCLRVLEKKYLLSSLEQKAILY